MRRLSTFSVCFGNPDEDLQTLASVDTEITTANSTDIVAFREGDFCASKGNVSYHSCIRAKDCTMLVIGSRCKPCQDVRRTLQKRRLRDDKRKDRPSKNFVHTRTPHNVMTRENLLTKLDQQRVEMKSLNSELSKLRRKCEQEIDTKGVQLQDSESSETSWLFAEKMWKDHFQMRTVSSAFFGTNSASTPVLEEMECVGIL